MMNGLEKINQRIRQDGSDEIAAIQAEAEGRVRSIRADFRAQIVQMEAEAAERRARTVAERLERLGGSAEMERRQLLLAAKQGCRLLVGDTRTGLGHAAEADGLGTNSSQLLLRLVCHKAVLGTGRKGQSQNSDEGDILSSNHVSYIIYNKE